MAPPVDNASLMSKLDAFMTKMDASTTETNRRLEGMQTSIDSILLEQGSIQQWKPQLETKVTELQDSLSDLKLKVDLFIHEQPKSRIEEAAQCGVSTSAHLGVTAHAEAPGLECHHEETTHRRVGAGVVTTLVPPPVTGPHHSPSSSPTHVRNYDVVPSFTSAIPQMDFPKFDGSNPRIWVRRCETYFDVYSIPPHNWVKFATMNFSGSAAFWMQSIEINLRKCCWEDLCQSVIDRFERDQHNHIIRQFFHIKQSASVSEYIELFDALVHQLLAHDPYFNPAVITSRFVDGLKSDIKAIVLVHRPKDLDTASSLAILQEEVLLGQPSKEWKRIEESQPTKLLSKYTSALYNAKTQATQAPPESKRSSFSHKTKVQDEKLAAVMAYRKAKGLCYKCGMKWGPTHTCPATVPLHVVEELWQMVQEEDIPSVHPVDIGDSDSGDDLMAISSSAFNGTTTGKTIKLQCYISHHQAIVLIDSGSSHNFISEQFAALLPNWKQLSQPIQVKVADGGLIVCTHELVDCDWLVQGHQFKTTFKILPLKCYDAILGMDWLEAFSPMKVQWAQKWLSFRYKGQKIKLQGLLPSFNHCMLITEDQFYAMQRDDDIWCVVQVYSAEEQTPHNELLLSSQIQQLVHTYSDIFAEPTGLPPSRAKDHVIPLMTGTQPFRLRPYRYTPAQKTEIEQQVAHLLRNHMIQESSSPFASPVLLVKKKTGEWRLCVDFRRLNAYTIKNKFPLPIIEELFEELFGAKWFTTLDLRSGFHQILVAEADRHKTAFQTHFGHFEYKVMPYGLTGAPATFQAIMNHILKPLLRKCVVVFIDDILIYSKSYEEHLQHIQMVFDLLKEHQFKVRLSKCSFAKQELKYLGHVISAQGVSTDPSKLVTVQKWPTPTSVKELRGFLGLAGYYRRFVRNFGMIAKPLTDLLKKGQMFVWTPMTEQAFQILKQALISAPVLALPNFQSPFVIETDASDKGIGAVL
ncbi:unnamed protein product [Urochloa humidicola]